MIASFLLVTFAQVFLRTRKQSLQIGISLFLQTMLLKAQKTEIVLHYDNADIPQSWQWSSAGIKLMWHTPYTSVLVSFDLYFFSFNEKKLHWINFSTWEEAANMLGFWNEINIVRLYTGWANKFNGYEKFIKNK